MAISLIHLKLFSIFELAPRRNTLHGSKSYLLSYRLRQAVSVNQRRRVVSMFSNRDMTNTLQVTGV